MDSSTLQKEIEEAVPALLNMARGLTWKKVYDNCKYILTEIKDSQDNFHIQQQLRKKENDKKVPVTLQEIMPILQDLYHNLYDINLHIYRVTKGTSIIDIRYFPKSSLDEEYRQKILSNPPMLHCKISMPPWLSDKTKKFDINWEHHKGTNKLKLFFMRLKLRTHRR
jgi:hypothetical protein